MLNNGTFIANRYEIVGQVGTGGMSDVYKRGPCSGQICSN